MKFEKEVDKNLGSIELSDYTRSNLRKVFFYSILGLFVGLGSTGDFVGLSTLITEIKINKLYLSIFIISSILYYAKLSQVSFSKDEIDLSQEFLSQTDDIKGSKIHARHLLRAIFERDNKLFDEKNPLSTREAENLESQNKNDHKELIKVEKRFQSLLKLKKSKNFIQTTEYYTPNILGAVSIIVLVINLINQGAL